MNNRLLEQSSSQMIVQSDKLEEIVRVKVQLEKCKLQLEGYRAMQERYRVLSQKSNLMEKQLNNYQQVMGMFFDRVRHIMKLLAVNDGFNQQESYHNNFIQNNKHSMNSNESSVNASSYRQYNNNIEESFSFINHNQGLKVTTNPALTRKVNKLNSLKTIYQSYLSPQSPKSPSISFYQQDTNFTLIQAKLTSMLEEINHYRKALSSYERSLVNINENSRQHQVIVKKLQAEVKMKDKEVEECESHIVQMLRKIENMKDEVNSKDKEINQKEKQINDKDREIQSLKEHLIAKEKQITTLQQQLTTKQHELQHHKNQQQTLIKTYQQLQHRISELNTSHSTEEQKRSIVREKCQHLIKELNVPDDSYLLNHLLNDPHVLKSTTQLSSTLNFSQMGTNRDRLTKYGKDKQLNITKNKYQLVFD